MTRVFVLEMIKANLCWQEYQIEFMKQKAYSLLSTISWIADMSLQNVIFEIDCKQLYGGKHSTSFPNSEFGVLF